MRKILLVSQSYMAVFLFLFSCTSIVFGQSPNFLPVDKPNYTSFTNRYQTPDNISKSLNGKLSTHPDADFTPDASTKNSIELLEKRTINSKYFVDRDTASKFFILKANSPLHYKQNGQWLTIDKHLEKMGDGVYEAPHQMEPVGINAAGKNTYIKTIHGFVHFNNWKLYGQNQNQQQLLAQPNWRDLSAGDDGVYIRNFFPGIDAEMKVSRGGIKTNFIIRENAFRNYEAFVFKDEFTQEGATAGLQFAKGGSEAEQSHGVDLISAAGTATLHIARGYRFTRSNAGISNVGDIDFKLQANTLSITLQASDVDKELQKGELVIDPQVTSIATLDETQIMGSMNCGSATNNCEYTLDVPTPAKTTITGIAFQFTYYANSPAGQNKGWFNIRAGVCSTGSYTVVDPNQNTGPGSVGTVGQYAYINNLVACMPPPSCSPRNVTFTMRFWNTYCGPRNNVCSNEYVEAYEPWIMRIDGRTAELNTIVASAATICAGSSTNLTVTARNGVAPYTYKWAGGETTPTITVSPTTGTSYSTVITDNCGTTATGNISVSVTQLPVVSSATSNSPVCSGNTLNLSTPSIIGATYNWTGPDNFPVSQQNPSIANVTTAAAGTYTIVATRNNCASLPVATVVIINPSGTPSITIAAQPASICAGTPVTFSATPVLEGTAPVFQWKLNGANVGSNSTSYTNNKLAGSDMVSCVLTSNAPCITTTSATSNSVAISVTPVAIPSVSIAGGSIAVCAGTLLTFNATPINGGSTPAYQWKVNGNNTGTVASTFSSNTLADGDVITTVLISNAACAKPTTLTSNNIVVKIAPLVTPVISISSSATSVCEGTMVNFTATPTNGGAAPAYQWKVNGVNAGANSPTFSSSILANNDMVSCVLTSNANCTTSANAVSNEIILSVSTPVIPSVSITASASTICAGTTVTFTATPTNGGNTPLYQWKLNGVNVATNNAVYANPALLNGDVVTCVLTSNASCVSSPFATSNAVTITVNPLLKPTVSIAATATTFCAGTMVTFTAAPVNAGMAPAYQWKVNGNNIGTNAPTHTSNALASGDIVTTVLTSNAACALPSTATSNNIIVSVTATVTPSVNITSSANAVCQGTTVIFNATATNGGTTPVYQWKINGANAGTNSPTFSSSTLANNDKVGCVLTSSITCVTAAAVSSNVITISVNAPLTPSIVITTAAAEVCQGASVIFTAMVANAGTSPAYQWTKNGVNTGTNAAVFSPGSLATGDVILCKLTVNTSCAFSSATSNSITLTVKPVVIPTVVISGNSKLCEGQLVLINASTTNVGVNPQYKWLVNGAVVSTGTSSQFVASALKNKDAISVQVVPDIVSCLSVSMATSGSIIFEVYPLPVVHLQPDTTIMQGTSFVMRNTISGSGLSYQWTPAIGLNNARIARPVAGPQVTTTYRLTVTGTGNCSAGDTILIKVIRPLIIPNAFSPNGDGVNDTWQIPSLADYPGNIVDVFDRYGRAVFHSTGYALPWGGGYNGKPLPVATYYYIIQPRNGQPQRSGSITILK